MNRLTPKTQGFLPGRKIFVRPSGEFSISEASELPEDFSFGAELPSEEGVYFMISSTGAFVVRITAGAEVSVGTLYFFDTFAFPNKLLTISNITGDTEGSFSELDNLNPITCLKSHPDGIIYASRRTSVPRISLYLFSDSLQNQWEWHNNGSTLSGQISNVHVDENGDIYYPVMTTLTELKVAKVNSAGVEQWVRTHPSPVTVSSTFASGAKCDKVGNLLWVAARGRIHVLDATTGDELDSLVPSHNTITSWGALTDDGTFWTTQLNTANLIITPYTFNGTAISEGTAIGVSDDFADGKCVVTLGNSIYVSGTHWGMDMGYIMGKVSNGTVDWVDVTIQDINGFDNLAVTPSGEVFGTNEVYELFPIITGYTPTGNRIPGFEPIERSSFLGFLAYKTTNT